MSKIMIAVLASCLAVPVLAHEGHKHAESKEAGTVKTVSGELVDMACFMGHGGSGEKHAKCAGACVTGGAPMGLQTKDGALYLIVGDHADEKPYVEAKALAGSNVTLTGKVVSKGGVQALIVTKTEKLVEKAAAKP